MKNDISTVSKIIKIIGESKLTEISIEKEEFKLFIKKSNSVLTEPVIEEEIIKEKTTEEIQLDNEENIVSESVGRFYYIDKDGEPMMSPGMEVTKGQKIGYIEAIGIKTNIKSEVDGKIKEILIENGEVVEYGKILVTITV